MDAITEAAMDAALIRELCSGRAFVEQMAKYRETQAAMIAHQDRQNINRKSTLRKLAEIPQREYLLMAQKYGSEYWDNREFVKDFQRHEPELAVEKM
jgi:hypothetical protein